MEKGEIRFDGPTAELLDRPDVLRSVFLEGASKGLGQAGGTWAEDGPDLSSPDERHDDTGADIDVDAVLDAARTRHVGETHREGAVELRAEGLAVRFGGVVAVPATLW